MQDYFYALIDHVKDGLVGEEILTATYSGERSDFIRLNKSRIRQPGTVEQGYVSLRLIDGQRHVASIMPLSSNREVDFPRADRVLTELRERVALVPEDPFISYARDEPSSERIGEDRLPAAADAISELLERTQGHDLVGIHAQGGVYRGYASSLGQRNWFSSHSFNLDFSCYLHDDKAVKTGYAGFEWKTEELESKLAEVSRQLEVLAQPPRELEPGSYSVYLSPKAMVELLGMMAWGGFGKRSHATRQTAFLRMIEGEASLADSVSLAENIADGVDSDFTGDGFKKPDRIELIRAGKLGECLISPRSAREFECEANGADSDESPSSLDMAAGDIPTSEVPARLGDGVYVNNLWYLNFSDRNSFRITGMTRFATFWVEGGEIVAPVNVMRFDESVYHVLGDNLEGLTAERDLILSSDSYSQRGTSSARVPGAIVRDFHFTL